MTIATGKLSLTDQAAISNETYGNGNTGNFMIEARSLSAIDSNIAISVHGKGKAGELIVRVSDSVELSGEILTPDGEIIAPGGILNQVDLEGEGQGGNLTIETKYLSISNGSKVQAASFGQGSPGELLIRSSEVEVFNTPDANNQFVTGILTGLLQDSRSEELPTGEKSDLTIETERLSIRGGARVSGETSGLGNGSDLFIQAEDLVEVVGTDRFGNPSSLGSQVNPSRPFTLINPEAITGNGGSLIIKTRQLSVRDGGEVSVSTFARGDAGNILVQASDLVEILGTSLSSSPSLLVTGVNPHAKGNGGDLTIETRQLSVRDGGEVSASTSGEGNAGNLTIRASELVELLGESSQFSGGLFAQVNITPDGQIGRGDGGDLTIETRQLNVSDGSKIQVSTFGDGDAGDLLIRANVVEIFNTSKENFFNTGIFAEVADLSDPGIPGGNGLIAKGNGGNLTIETRQLSVRDGAEISASTSGEGNAGSILVRKAELVFLDNSSISTVVNEEAVAEQPGNIEIQTRLLSLTNNAQVTARTLGKGTAGNVTITANTLESNSRSEIRTDTQTNFDAGDITLNIASTLSLSNSSLIAETTGDGKAGDITVNSPQLNLSEGATISARTAAQGDGGSITVNAPISVTLGENSQLNVETSGAGKAGNIDITSDTVTIDKDAQISATAKETATNTEEGGSITINASNLNLSGKLGIFAETQGQAPAGNLILKPNENQPNLNIQFTDTALISARTTNQGTGGSISISSPQTINIAGQGKITVETIGNGQAGNINIATQQLNIGNQTEITASTTGTNNAGNINLNASQISLQGAIINAFTNGTGSAGSINLSYQGNNAQTINLDNSTISTEIQKNGVATEPSNITLTSDTLNLDNNFRISASTSGTGNAGDISLINQQLNLNNSNISATSSGVGNAGSINLPNTQNLSLNQSQISVSTSKKGDAGSINISIAQNISLNQSRITASTLGEGDTGVINLTGTEKIDLTNNSEISNAVETGGIGNAKEITLTTPQLSLENSNITSSTNGIGNAGSISIPNAQIISLNNSTISTEIQENGVATEPSNITLISDTLNLNNNSSITASTLGTGNAGEITLNNRQLNLNNSNIIARSTGIGNAGSISLPNTQNLNLNQSQISVSTNKKGDAGSITIPTAQNINLNQSSITASTSGEGNTGIINLTGTEKITLTASQISSSVEQGAFGNSQQIILNTPNLSLYNSVLSAATSGTGDAGSIVIL